MSTFNIYFHKKNILKYTYLFVFSSYHKNFLRTQMNGVPYETYHKSFVTPSTTHVWREFFFRKSDHRVTRDMRHMVELSSGHAAAIHGNHKI